jgi:hypothetical protein
MSVWRFESAKELASAEEQAELEVVIDELRG